MNYLAHAYLSFNDPDILVGNMISDYIKGKKQFLYPGTVQTGIRLHRHIDNYTDAHDATRELKSFFRPQYRLYSGAFADVVYDHFLANDKNEFPGDTSLQQFATVTYQMLEPYVALYPPYFAKIFPSMKEYNWLYNYKHKWAIEKSFGGLVRRAAYLNESKIAFDLFNEHYQAMQLCYHKFFPDLKIFAGKQLEELRHGK
ncbi:MAG: DUF479 domain-containing protein [Chitinophagaceae bacterium]|nr:DUF479 domain-containing protein [Chitinophagaceae bacterium]